MAGRTLIFDCETHDAYQLYIMEPEEFVRLSGFKYAGSDHVYLTRDLDVLRNEIMDARFIIGHNIHTFDLRAIFGTKSDVPMQLADEGRVLDSFTHSVIAHPAPRLYTDRHGKKARATKPEESLKWHGLDEQAYQLGVQGKTDEFERLALRFAPAENHVDDGTGRTKIKQRVAYGAGRIPLDDPEYQAYLIGDVNASEIVARKLLERMPLTDYARREQRIESRKACIMSNGFRVDRPAAEARVEELRVQREGHMERLVKDFNFPTQGAQPWKSNAGKQAICLALQKTAGIYPDNDAWPRTAGGEPSFGGQVMIDLTKGTPAEELGVALGELMGQRSLAKLALDSCYPDGFAHPEITMLQSSARWSTTKPGLTVWTAHGDNAIEKAYFLPDSDDHVLLEFDYSNADARVVAALSGDYRFAERFQPGADGHMINAIAAWGADVVATDPTGYRQKAKAPGHGWSYGGREKTLALISGMSVEDMKTFVDGMDRSFYKVVEWQNKTRQFARRNGYVENEWGRRMPVEKGREFTQAPALLGQNGTREIICDYLISIPHHAVRTIKAQVHDALVKSVPRAQAPAWREHTLRRMEATMNPRGGQRIDFPASCGPEGANWHASSH